MGRDAPIERRADHHRAALGEAVAFADRHAERCLHGVDNSFGVGAEPIDSLRSAEKSKRSMQVSLLQEQSIDRRHPAGLSASVVGERLKEAAAARIAAEGPQSRPELSIGLIAPAIAFLW